MPKLNINVDTVFLLLVCMTTKEGLRKQNHNRR